MHSPTTDDAFSSAKMGFRVHLIYKRSQCNMYTFGDTVEHSPLSQLQDLFWAQNNDLPSLKSEFHIAGVCIVLL